MKNRYDVIILGAGIGGLASGSLLSKNNKVLILEKNKTLGGYCSDFTRNGFRFESSVQAMNGLYKDSPIYEVLRRAGALKGTAILEPKHLYRSIFPEHDIIVPKKNLNSYKKLLASLFPGERLNIEKLFDTMRSVYLEMDSFYSEKSIKRSPFILKYARKTLKDLLDEFGISPRLRAIIAQYWMYRGLPPSRLSAITFSYIWYDYTSNGSYFPQGGTRSLVENMAKAIKRNGGDVVCGMAAEKLYVKNGRLEEVGLEGGRRLGALACISNIDIFKTFDMIENIDGSAKKFIERLRKNSISISAFKIYLGLSCTAKDLGMDGYEIFVNPSYDIESMYAASYENDFHAAPYSITVYSNISDRFCEKNRSLVSIGILSGYDYWRALSRQEYKTKKARSADILLSRIDKVFPRLRQHIDTKVIATPLTMERYTGNSQGSIYGWNARSLIEEMRFMNPTTPVRGLLLSSHWTKMGGGVGGVLLSSDRVNELLCGKS